MITIALSAEDYSAIRFCVSPLGEVVLSIRVLQDRARHALYLDWIRDTAAVVARDDFETLCRLIRPSGYIPDFLTPPPIAAQPSIDDEFEVLAATPDEIVVKDVTTLLEDGAPGDELAGFLEHPRRYLDQFITVLRRYWKIVLEPHWSRMNSVLEGDILHRARLLAVNGPAGLFARIHPAMKFDERQARIFLQKRVDREVTLAGAGLRLIPRMFAWPDMYVVEKPLPVSIAYPPIGLALWGQVAADARSELAAAVGFARASVLLSLTTPTHVTELASRLGVTKGAVSQHLHRLTQAGLVESIRQGAFRYFHLSRRGEMVVSAFGHADDRT